MNLTTGVISTVAGNGTQGFSGDGGQATAAELFAPKGAAVDSSGHLFIADGANERIREVDLATGVISTVAGNGTQGFSGDGGQATAAQLDDPFGVAVDSSDHLFIADHVNDRIREVDLATGVISTVAGNGTLGFSGDGGQATAAELFIPSGVAVDSSGHLFIADFFNDRIREVGLATGVISTVAGNGILGFSGDGGHATAAELGDPNGVAVDSSGDLFIADLANDRIREVGSGAATVNITPAPLTITPDDKSKVYGAALPTLTAGYSGFVNGDTAANLTTQPTLATTATAASHVSGSPYAITASGAVDADYTISYVPGALTVTPVSLTITADDKSKAYGAALPPLTASYSGFVNGDTAADLTTPPTLATTATAASQVSGSPYAITASGAVDADYTISYLPGKLTVTPAPVTITVGASASSAVYGQAISLSAYVSASPSPAPSVGNVSVFDNGAFLATAPVISGFATFSDIHLHVGAHLISATYSDASGDFASSTTAVGPNSIISTVAGNGTFGFSGDGGQATAAELDLPTGAAVDSSGHLFIADQNSNRIREVDLATGVISTVAGNGTQGFGGDGGQATAAELGDPEDVAVDSSGHLFIADYLNERIREVDLATGVISTVAGNGTQGFSGDGGQATAAELFAPAGVAVDSSGHLFIADYLNDRIREVDLATGVISTVAGNGIFGFSGDGGQATAAEIDEPYGVAVDSSGHLFIADYLNERIREVDLATGVISTVAGNGTFGFSGDGGQATAAELDLPTGVAVDSSGHLFIADYLNERIREVDLATGVISTVAGNGTFGFSGDGGQATAAELGDPYGVAVDSSGNLFIADLANDRIREVGSGAATVNITPAPLTITADDKSKVYGAALPILTAGYSGFVNGDTAANLTTQPTLATTATVASHVSGSPYTITASGAVDADYTISYVPGALTVTPVSLTITADDKSKAYGAALPPLTASYSGFVNGDTAADLTTPPTLATTATAVSQVTGSPYAITASGAVDADYTISYVLGRLTVTPVSLTITADDKSKVYGASLPTLTASYSGFVNGDTASNLTTLPALGTTARAGSHVLGSPYTIMASGSVDADYTISYVPGALTVTPVPLTITADDKTKVYGAVLPTLTASYSGFINGDTAANLTTQPTLATTATAASHVSGSPYTITASGAVDADYTISYVPGALTVTPVALTITADDKTKVYGAALPTLTASYSGFVNGDTAASLTTGPTLVTAATTASHVSGSPFTITASGAVDADYTISYVPGALTVTPVPLTITADDKSKVYGAALPTLTAGYSGFVNGDTAASLTTGPTLVTAATAGSHVLGSPYTITASGAVDADYTISYLPGALTVAPAPLTITADDKSKVYGAVLPTLTASYSGFINGDTAANLTTQPTLTTTATAASHVSGSPYAITASGAVDADYTISYLPGALTVTPVALTITADDKSKVYGAALPTLTAGYSGFVNGDTAASLTTGPTLVTAATAGSHVLGSPYTIMASGAVDADYTISYLAGALTVTPVPLTITADDKSKTYGDSLPTLTASYSGFVNGDTAASLTTGPTLATTATAASHVSGSPYAITASGALDADYTISYVAGALAVTPAPLTITADDKSKAYGAALPPLTASYSGFVNGDTAAHLTAQPTLATTATAASHVSGSPYTITASGAVDADYTISYVPGRLTVAPAPLKITADDKSKAYGAALPTLTASYSGFINGDTAADLTTQPTLATTATAGSHVSGSPYAITASGAVDADYTISYVSGSLTVTPATLTVQANDASKVQGAPNPTFTDTITGFVNGDTSSVVSGAANLSTTATVTSGLGSYPITAAQGTLSAADYNFAFQNGTLTVNPSTPFAANGAVYTIGSGTITVSAADGLLANDTGPNPLAVTASTVTGAEGGTFVFHADGSFNYMPGADFPGYDSAPFSVTDASGDNATATVNVLSQHAGVVWKFYESVLNRVPDPGGLAYWTNYLNNGGQTGDMAVGFFESTELLDKIITNYYQQYLLRTPDASGLAFWVEQWQATGEPEGIKAGFADSQEFYNSAGGTPGSWLTQLYQRILDRSPDSSGYQFWLNYYQQQLAAGTAAGPIEQAIALGFFDSAEAYGDDVTGWFNEYLGRNPAAAELAQYQSQMESGGTDRTIEQEITNLAEYANEPPMPADGTAAPLPDYYQTPAASPSSQAAVAAKDAFFSGF